MSVLLALGASDAGIDLEAVDAATAIPKPELQIAPPSPTVSPQKGLAAHSRPLNPDAQPLQMPAVTMEQYTACVHALRLARATDDLDRLLQQQWMQWGMYAQQYASMYSFPSQPDIGANYGVAWSGGSQPPTAAASDVAAAGAGRWPS